MKVCKDQMDYFITVPDELRRIVSLVPSQTELLCDLGLEDRLIGITKFCIHPDSAYQSKVRVGGTKNFDLDAIKLLNPDIIIANKEENEKERLLVLKTMFPVWISDVNTLPDALDMVKGLGGIFGKQVAAEKITKKIEHNFAHIVPLSKPVKVAYFIWRKPYMTVNRHTFIHDMLQRCGFVNVFAGSADRYPRVTTADLQQKKPDVILLSSEPYPFKEKHFAELQEVLPGTRMFIVDGEMFSWYGSRLIKSPGYFNKLTKKIQPLAKDLV